MLRFTVMSFVLLVLLVPAQGAVAQTVYEEGTFDLAHWTLFGPFTTPEDNLGGPDTDAHTPTSGRYVRCSYIGSSGNTVPSTNCCSKQ